MNLPRSRKIVHVAVVAGQLFLRSETRKAAGKDLSELSAKRASAEAVEDEVDAVVEEIRNGGDVLGSEEVPLALRFAAGNLSDAEREEDDEPANAVRDVEDDESC